LSGDGHDRERAVGSKPFVRIARYHVRDKKEYDETKYTNEGERTTTHFCSIKTGKEQ
jgi:hypothetical protein